MMTVVALGVAAHEAAAQSLGTLRWQIQPYCNVLTLDVIAEGSVFRLQGYDDQCGETGGMWSVVLGTAVLAPGGVARIGLSYTFPGAAVTEGALIRASIDLATFSGTWDDNGTHAGTFMFAPNGGTGGRVRDPWSPHSNAFTHFVNQFNRPPAGGAATNITCFSHPLTDGNPSALILVTVNRGLASDARPAVASSYSVYFDNNGTPLAPPLDNNVWCISRDDSQPMPLNAAFTVRVVAP
jgi:hypothetical protein